MEYIAHRINKAEELAMVLEEYGVELDLRDDLNGRIYIQHNPFENGEDFEEYLKQYHLKGTMILNVKSERIEHKVLKLVEKYHITNYFFLDSSFPMIYLLTNQGESNVAIRFSEFEGMDTVRSMAGKAKWIWVDTFTKIPVNRNELDEMHRIGYKVCLVSPELQGRPEDIETYAKLLNELELDFDAICTKQYNIDLWKELLEKPKMKE